MRKVVPYCLLLASAAATCAPAAAQTATADAEVGASASEALPGEIIVTAQRRSENIQTVPVSVTAVTGEVLASRPINDLAQPSRSAPSLQTGTDNNFALRGVGKLAFAGTVDSSVARARVELIRRSYTGKAKLLIERSDALTIYAIADYSELHGAGGLFSNTYLNAAPNSVNLPSLNSAGIVPGPDNFLYEGDGGIYRDLKVGEAQASVSYVLDSGIEIGNLAAWRVYDQDQQLDVYYLPNNSTNTNRMLGNYGQYSHEFRIALPSESRLSAQGGLYYFDSTLKIDNLIAGNNYLPSFVALGFPFCVGATVNPGPPPNCSVNNFAFLGRDRADTLRTKSYAGFGQMTFAVTDAIKLTAWGRLTHDKIDIDLIQGRNRYFLALGGPNGRVVQSDRATVKRTPKPSAAVLGSIARLNGAGL